MTAPNITFLRSLSGEESYNNHVATDGDRIYVRSGANNSKIYVHSLTSFADYTTISTNSNSYGILCKDGYVIVGAGKVDASHFTLQSYRFNFGTGQMDLIDAVEVGPLAGYLGVTGYVTNLCDGPEGVFFAAMDASGIGSFSLSGAGEIALIDSDYGGGGGWTGYTKDVAYDGTYVYGAHRSSGITSYSYVSDTLSFIVRNYLGDADYAGDPNAVGVGDAREVWGVACDGNDNIFAIVKGESPNYYLCVWSISFNGSVFDVGYRHSQTATYAPAFMDQPIAAYGDCFFMIGNPMQIVYFDGSSFSVLFEVTSSAQYDGVAYSGGIIVMNETAVSEQLHLYTFPVPVAVKARPTSTLFVPITSAKAYILGSKVTDSEGTSTLQVTEYKKRDDYQDVYIPGGDE